MFYVVQLETLEALKQTLVDDRPKKFEDCINWARHHWQAQYHNQIAQLLYNFPKDQVSAVELIALICEPKLCSSW